MTSRTACSIWTASIHASGRSEPTSTFRSIPCRASFSEKTARTRSTSGESDSATGEKATGFVKSSRWAIRFSRRSTSAITACRCSRWGLRAGSWWSTSWVAARMLARGLRSPWATAADIWPSEASFSAWMIPSWARRSRSAIARNSRARPPSSSRDRISTARAWSNSPRPTSSIIVVSPATGRAKARAMSTAKSAPNTTEDRMMGIRTIVVERSVACRFRNARAILCVREVV